MDIKRNVSWQKEVLEIRKFEYLLLDLHKRGLLSGTVHTCIGQELIAVAVHKYLNGDTDSFFATHRGHGHYIAYGGPKKALLSEMTGRNGALVKGRGGSQHLNFKNFYSNGIQGAGASQAVGYAWAKSIEKEEGISVFQLGDGTLGEGSVYEAFNIASILSSPVLFLLEYNGWAQSTNVEETIAGSIKGRADAFGIEYSSIDDTDIEVLFEHVSGVINKVRRGKPYFLEIKTRRLLAHSKGDDNRDKSYIEKQWDVDPLSIWAKEFPQKFKQIEKQVEYELEVLVNEVLGEALIDNVGDASLYPLLTSCSSDLFAQSDKEYSNFVNEINLGLRDVLASAKCILLGEDIADPYGGAFKVSQGLSTLFKERVFSTPISESAIVGVSIGASLANFKPICEIMFADFLTLALDQIINSAAKYFYMFGSNKKCPITIRIVSGGYRGYGPTHSQNTELLLCGIPGVKVLALNPYHDPRSFYNFTVNNDLNPKIIVEDKNLYGLVPNSESPTGFKKMIILSDQSYPLIVFKPLLAKADFTMVCYGAIASSCIEVLSKVLYEDELFGELIIVTQIWPFSADYICQSVKETNRLIVVEVNPTGFGFGAEVISDITCSIKTKFRASRVGALEFPIPAAKNLENQVLPSVEKIYKAVLDLF
jgi:2-oxoisovalerate dehydrogenase E1 component